MRGNTMIDKMTAFIEDSKRILTVSKKPAQQEFMVMAKVTGIGIIVIGLIGYTLQLLFQLTGIGF